MVETMSDPLRERYNQQCKEIDQRVTNYDQVRQSRIHGRPCESVRGRQVQVYKITELVSGKYRGSVDTPIAVKPGENILITDTDQEVRWTEHLN